MVRNLCIGDIFNNDFSKVLGSFMTTQAEHVYMCPKCWGEEFSPGNCKYDGTPLVLKDGEDHVLPESVYQLIRKYDSTSDDKAGFELVIYNPVLFRQELSGAIEQLLATREKEMRREYEGKIITMRSDIAHAIGYCRGLGHPESYLEKHYSELLPKEGGK